MPFIKKLLSKYFQSFNFFYRVLRYRVFIIVGLSIFVGILDGFGLSMIIPLLQLAEGASQVDSEQMGNLSFIVEAFDATGIALNVTSALALLLICFMLKGLFKFMEGYFRVVYQQYFIRDVRFDNADALSDFAYQSFVNSDSGRIQNTFSGEVERVSGAFRTYFMTAQAAVLVGVYVTMAFLSNPQFAVLVSVGGAITNVIFKRLYAATKKASKSYTAQAHNFQGLLIQKVIYFKYLKATGLITNYAEKLKESILNIEQLQKRIGVLSASMQALREPLVMLVVVTVIIVQRSIFSESLDAIALSLVLFYRALTYLMSMQNQWNSFLSVSGSLENMTEFIQELKEGKEVYGEEKIEGFNDTIEIERIGFSYGDTEILKEINLKLHKNETIAFIGESGSGKTTLMNLIVGLIKPNQGVLRLDGKSYENLDIRSLQKKIGYITQEPVIFNDTIFNNVTFWGERNEESYLRFNEALKKAAIFDFIQETTLKGETLLGNNGINLSGGQRQRLSIARELYKDVDFLMMDEATSALDSETEKAIQENIDALKGKYTILIIAHRLSTVKNADRIVLLKKGQVDDVGSFEELVERSPEFKKMVSLQDFG